MGILDQLTKAGQRAGQSVRHAMDRAAPLPLAHLPLSERLGLRALSDEDLRRDLERRRRARRRPAHGRPAADDELDAAAKARRDRVRDRSAAKCYALLELPLGAPLSDIEAAYRKLLRQYHPDRFLGDGERHASAVALVTSLTDAYLSLRNGR
jgi:DnaJ-domain-containing protein 1